MPRRPRSLTLAHNRTFDAMPGFDRRWRELGLTEADQIRLMWEIMADPEGAGKVILGAGSIRKLRFGDPDDNRGERGAYRVWYVHVPDLSVVVLVTVYDKADEPDLSQADKKALTAAVDRVVAARRANEAAARTRQTKRRR